MPRAAVALDSPNPGASARAPRQFRLRRMHFVLVAIAIVAVWLVFVFARSLGDVDRAAAKQRSVAAEAATLQAQLDAVKRELAIAQTDSFQRLQARAYGMGAAGEMVFTLPLAPSPPAIVPLGAGAAGTSTAESDSTAVKPLDAWLKLIFGN